MKKTHALILAAVFVIALLGLYGCHPAAPQATEPTAATEATETTAATGPAETEAPTEAPTEESTVPAETEAPTAPAEVNRPQGGANQPGTTGSGSGTQQPPVTPPPATQPPVTVPPATQPPVTEPSATEHTHYYVVTSTIPATCTQDGSVTYTCDVCWDSYTEVILAAHVWVYRYEPEVAHEVYGIMCNCGAIFSTADEWGAHVDSFDVWEAFEHHGGYGEYTERIIDSPFREWNECSVCGAIK